MSRKTIKLPEDEYERHNDRRQEMGLTWSEYIDGEAPEFDTLDDDDVRRIVRNELDRFERELEQNLRQSQF